MAIAQGNYSLIRLFGKKLDMMPDISVDDINLISFKINWAYAEYCLRNYQGTAEILSSIPYEHLEQGIFLPKDVAYLWIASSFASLSGKEIADICGRESGIGDYLDAAPEIRELLSNFMKGKYDVCIKLLQSRKEELCFDCYLSVNADDVLNNSIDKLLVAYLEPYSVIELQSIASYFFSNVANIELRIIKLLKTNELKGKLNCIDKVNKSLC